MEVRGKGIQQEENERIYIISDIFFKLFHNCVSAYVYECTRGEFLIATKKAIVMF